MKGISYQFTVRFSDLDANNHMANTAYSQFATQSRFHIFNDNNFDAEKIREHQLGPIFFTEELRYLAEIKGGEVVRVETFLSGLSESGHKWKFHHKLFRGDGKLAAEVNALGGWLDLEKRKIAPPPPELMNCFLNLPKTEDFATL